MLSDVATSKLGQDRRSSYFRAVQRLAIVVILVTGCRSRATGPIAQEQTNLSWLGSMYRTYIGQNQGHPPKTIDDLRKFVEKTATTEQLGRLKVANANELFT